MYIYSHIYIYIYTHLCTHMHISYIYTTHTHIGGGIFLYTKNTKKINYVSQPKIYYYTKNIHSIRLKPSKISTLAHTKNAILLHTRISYKIFITYKDCGKIKKDAVKIHLHYFTTILIALPVGKLQSMQNSTILTNRQITKNYILFTIKAINKHIHII